MSSNATSTILLRRQLLAQHLVLLLPGFGRWASRIREFETPYGSAGIRQLEVLYVLRHDLISQADSSATEIAHFFQIQRSVVTRILAKLERGGYIERSTDPGDARSQQVTITERGRMLSDYVEHVYFDEMLAALGSVGDGELECLERSLASLEKISAVLNPGGKDDRWQRRLHSSHDTTPVT